MKKLLLLCFLVAQVSVKAQTLLSYSKVIETKDVVADDAFKRVELWAINTFNRPNKNIQLKDKESKTIVIKASMPFQSVKGNAGDINGTINYTLNIFFKDGRFKVEIRDFEHKGRKSTYDFGLLETSDECSKKIMFASKKWINEIYTDMKATSNKEFVDISCILESVANTRIESQNDNW